MDSRFFNSEGELIAIEPIPGNGRFAGQHLLCIYDDAPPQGTGTRALMLLDRQTQGWLRLALVELAKEEEMGRQR